MLTPLPGSRDHRAAVDAGVPMDPDYNNFDSFHATTPHPHMSADEWTRAYREAWTEFYSYEHMRQALLRQNPHTYWGMFKCFLWYRASMVEGTHPMVTGFFRLKDRRSRRPGFPIESRWQFFRRRLRENAAMTLGYAKLALEMQELWLATRIPREDYGFLGDIRGVKARAAAVMDVKTGWSRIHVALAARLADLRSSAEAPALRVTAAMRERFEALRQAVGPRADEIARAADTTLRSLRVPGLPPLAPRSWLRRAGASLNVFHAPTLEARRSLSAYWNHAEAQIRSSHVWRLNPITFGWNAARDLKNAIVFFTAMGSERY
jgi:hypothetical protein